MFAIGDILLKVETRKYISNAYFETRQHAMLIVGIDEQGYPTVAHMKFTDSKHETGQLVIESCPRSKDLILIHAPFSKAVRDEIVAISECACSKNKLRIERQFLQEEYELSRRYFWADPQSRRGKMALLLQDCSCTPTNVLTDQISLISCHNFVLSTLSIACTNMGEQMPQGLRIPPRMAWADILYPSALEDETLNTSDVVRMNPSEKNSVKDEQTNRRHGHTLFAYSSITPQPPKCCQVKCIIL